MICQPWRIEMLGGLRAHRGNEVVTRFRARAAISLFSYLAYYHTHKHSREHLLDLLWPEDDPRAAQNRLRVYLSSLRSQFDSGETPGSRVIVADRATVGLREGSFTTDVDDFDRAFAEALQEPDDHLRIERLTTAIDLYGGELLPELYDEWVTQERRRLQHAYRHALHHVVRGLIDIRDYDRALHFARLAVAADGTDEEAARHVMRLYAATGMPSAALRQFEELRSSLADAFGAAPGARTQELASRIAERSGSSGDTERAPATPRRAPAAGAGRTQKAVAPADDGSRLPTHVLPAPMTRLFGRAPEVRQVVEQFALVAGAPANRLVTLTGPGGVGKTRIAVEAAIQLSPADPGFGGRVWFVALSDLRDPSLVATAIASVVASGQPPAEPVSRIVEALDGAPALLVLDNLEQIAGGAADLLETLLERLPGLACLATSRVALGVPGERDVAVAPLPIPSERPAQVDQLLTNPSAQLFLDRARSVVADYHLTPRNAEAVAALCRALEGLPLAIELAAARARVLTPQQMLAGMRELGDLLVNRLAPKDGRHRSMRAAAEWSVRLLAPDQRRVFARMSVFRGGWTPSAAASVLELDNEADAIEALEPLRMASLVATEEAAGAIRFRMLETLRVCAADHLSAQDRNAAEARHAAYYEGLARAARPMLTGPDASAWLDVLQRELDNLRAAFEWSGVTDDGAETGLALSRCLVRLWTQRGPLSDGLARARAVLNHPRVNRSSHAYVDALTAAGALANASGEYAEAENLLGEAVEVARRIGYDHGVAVAQGDAGAAKIRQGRYSEARSLIEESLKIHRRMDAPASVAIALNHLGLAADRMDDRATARRYYAESLAVQRRTGDKVLLAATLGNLGLIAEREGDLAEARRLQQESLEIHRELGNRAGIAMTTGNLGVIACAEGDFIAGRACFEECVAIFRALGMKQALALGLGKLGMVELRTGDAIRACALCEESLALHREAGGGGECESLLDLARALMARARLPGSAARLADARERLLEAAAQSRCAPSRLDAARCLEECARYAAMTGSCQTGAMLLGAANALRSALGAALPAVEEVELRAALSGTAGSAFASALAAGGAMSADEALEIATELVNDGVMHVS